MKKGLLLVVFVLLLLVSLSATEIKVIENVRMGFERYLGVDSWSGLPVKTSSFDFEIGTDFYFFSSSKNDVSLDFGTKVDYIVAKYPVLFVAPISRVTFRNSFAISFAAGTALGSYYLGGVEIGATYLFNKKNGIQFLMRFMIQNVKDAFPPKQFCIGYTHEF